MLNRILIGVTGSVAAYKAAALAGLLVKDGHDVRTVLTSGAEHFISPLTFEAITGNPVSLRVWEQSPGSTRMGHLELAKWADILVVAPASAGTLARLAMGLADDMLGAVALASRLPLLLAPAMETAMWEHPATEQNVRTLVSRGARLVGPGSGRLASGAEGAGRMAEPEEIAGSIRQILGEHTELCGVRVLVTAGPTYEPIDPVRFIGNRSSGKMGHAVAEEARDRGAIVTLVSGPTALEPPHGIDTLCVETHGEMRRAVLDRVESADVVVMAAAVADFTPAAVATQKIRRSEGMSLELSPTDDIAAAAAARNPSALHIGFALETADLLDKAREKMKRKGQQVVVANAVGGDHNPFGSDTNHVTILTGDATIEIAKTSKREVARRLWDVALELRPDLRQKNRSHQ